MNEGFKRGLAFAISAYLFWGLVPLYFKLVAPVSDFEVLAHRILWSVVMLAGVLFCQKRLRNSLILLLTKKNLLGLITSSVLISSNWMIFIYAIASGQTLESSYGYFISPLIIIALGVFVLKERLSPIQLVCLALTVLGVGYQLVFLNSVPWVALGLATTFGLYGLNRKQLSGVGPIQGVFLEALLAIPIAVLLILYTGFYQEITFMSSGWVWSETTGWAFENIDHKMNLLLVLLGFVTSAPLLLFAEGNKRLPYSINGFLQYITPTMHFGIAIYIFNEPMNFHKLISFAVIWSALVLLMFNRPILKMIGRFKHHGGGDLLVKKGKEKCINTSA